MHHDTVQVFRPTTKTNRAGEAVVSLRALENTDPVPWRNVHVRPRQQQERAAADRTVGTDEWMISSRPGDGDFDVRASDVVKLPTGELADVIGTPARPSDPVRGGIHHVEVLVRKVAAT